MAAVSQIQIRYTGCNRRLADVVNEVQAGQVLIELKCPRCGHPHLEVIRPAHGISPERAEATDVKVSAAEREVIAAV